MKAIILMAGQGKRLRPLTNECPKGMIKLDGKTILDRQMELFHEAGISDISVVIGYKSDSVVADKSFKVYQNDLYETTNMVYSLFCAREQLNEEEDIIISYGDILYTKEILQALKSSSQDIAVAVDMNWKHYFEKRFGDPYDDAESLVFGDNWTITSIGETKPDPVNVQAQFIGLLKFRGKGVQIIKDIYDTARISTKQIGWGRGIEQAYMTDLLQEVVNSGHLVNAVPIHQRWVEIDNLTDYEIAVEDLAAGLL